MVARGMAERRRTGGSGSGSRRKRPDAGSKRGTSSKRGAGSKRNSADSASNSEERILGTAPSAPDIRKLHLMEPSEEAKQHEPSAVDAMGHDKRREVVGHSYGPSKRSQIVFFVAVGVVVFVIVGGWLALVAAFDNPPEEFSDQAPWSNTAATPGLVAEQNAKPVPPLSPCGEPGNEWPIPEQSPCAPPNKANDFQGSSSGQ
jgi:hypothetical protein